MQCASTYSHTKTLAKNKTANTPKFTAIQISNYIKQVLFSLILPKCHTLQLTVTQSLILYIKVNQTSPPENHATTSAGY